MAVLHIHLFGHLWLSAGTRELEAIEGGKARELLGYLLLHRHRTHPRETLAGLLWGDQTTSQSRKYLRQALWQLQAALDASGTSMQEPLLLLEADAIRLNTSAPIWIDVDEFERACGLVRGIAAPDLTCEQAATLRAAVDLYRGDLLEGWYHDWCIYERERLQTMYVILLDKLMHRCEAHDEHELGLMYGETILGIDRAREETHRCLMRLYARAGKRTAALRQYQRCLSVLEQELGVGPSNRTVMLFEQIRADRFENGYPVVGRSPYSPAAPSALYQVVERLNQLCVHMGELIQQLQHELHVDEREQRRR
jgi:DNA-binding SARP family transcriptional activator